MERRNSKWDSENIPDQKGKVIIVTGATSGLGKEAAHVLAKKNGTVILAVRNIKKGKGVVEHLKKEYTSADASVRELDLASLESVRSFAESFTNDYDRLDVLINNAGIMMPPYSKTKDGFEIQMGTNHLGHFALTGLLMPILRKTEGSRVVAISSMSHAQGNINFSDLNWETRSYNTTSAYGDSKMANLYFTYELARKLDEYDSNPRVTAAHPGWTTTDLQRHSALMRFMNIFFGQGVEMGVLPTLRAAYDDNAKPGDYYGPAGLMNMRGYPIKHNSNARSHDKDAATELWDISEELTGVNYF